MSQKMDCPACGSYTSGVLLAYREGRPCPNCGLPALTAKEVMAARTRAADADLQRKYMDASTRLAELQRQHTWLHDAVDEFVAALVNGGFLPEGTSLK